MVVSFDQRRLLSLVGHWKLFRHGVAGYERCICVFFFCCCCVLGGVAVRVAGGRTTPSLVAFDRGPPLPSLPSMPLITQQPPPPVAHTHTPPTSLERGVVRQLHADGAESAGIDAVVTLGLPRVCVVDRHPAHPLSRPEVRCFCDFQTTNGGGVAFVDGVLSRTSLRQQHPTRSHVASSPPPSVYPLFHPLFYPSSKAYGPAGPDVCLVGNDTAYLHVEQALIAIAIFTGTPDDSMLSHALRVVNNHQPSLPPHPTCPHGISPRSGDFDDLWCHAAVAGAARVGADAEVDAGLPPPLRGGLYHLLGAAPRLHFCRRCSPRPARSRRRHLLHPGLLAGYPKRRWFAFNLVVESPHPL